MSVTSHRSQSKLTKRPKDQNKKQQQWTQKQKFLTDLRFIELYPNPAELSSNSLAKLYFRHPISRGSPYVQIFSPKFKPLATSKSTVHLPSLSCWVPGCVRGGTQHPNGVNSICYRLPTLQLHMPLTQCLCWPTFRTTQVTLKLNVVFGIQTSIVLHFQVKFSPQVKMWQCIEYRAEVRFHGKRIIGDALC